MIIAMPQGNHEVSDRELTPAERLEVLTADLLADGCRAISTGSSRDRLILLQHLEELTQISADITAAEDARNNVIRFPQARNEHQEARA